MQTFHFPRLGSPYLTPIAVGENVKIKGQTSVGQVMEINGKNATVAFGSIKTTVKIDRLERTNNAPKTEGIAKSTFVSSQTHDQMYEKKLSFRQDIDVRGMRGDEALQAVTYFIDDAILVGMDRVRILHGTCPAHSPVALGRFGNPKPIQRRNPWIV